MRRHQAEADARTPPLPPATADPSLLLHFVASTTKDADADGDGAEDGDAGKKQ